MVKWGHNIYLSNVHFRCVYQILTKQSCVVSRYKGSFVQNLVYISVCSLKIINPKETKNLIPPWVESLRVVHERPGWYVLEFVDDWFLHAREGIK